jgi:hypothetical protein
MLQGYIAVADWPTGAVASADVILLQDCCCALLLWLQLQVVASGGRLLQANDTAIVCCSVDWLLCAQPRAGDMAGFSVCVCPCAFPQGGFVICSTLDCMLCVAALRAADSTECGRSW